MTSDPPGPPAVSTLLHHPAHGVRYLHAADTTRTAPAALVSLPVAPDGTPGRAALVDHGPACEVVRPRPGWLAVRTVPHPAPPWPDVLTLEHLAGMRQEFTATWTTGWERLNAELLATLDTPGDHIALLREVNVLCAVMPWGPALRSFLDRTHCHHDPDRDQVLAVVPARAVAWLRSYYGWPSGRPPSMLPGRVGDNDLVLQLAYSLWQPDSQELSTLRAALETARDVAA